MQNLEVFPVCFKEQKTHTKEKPTKQ